MLSLRQLEDVCLFNNTSSDRCRYLGQDENEPSKFVCIKLSSQRQQIDDEIDDYIKEMRKIGRDPMRDSLPLGDNCQGYKIFRSLVQGYDC